LHLASIGIAKDEYPALEDLSHVQSFELQPVQGMERVGYVEACDPVAHLNGGMDGWLTRTR
jgi:hypothetical protein